MFKGKFFWSIFSTLMIGAFLVEFGFPRWIAHLYQQNAFNLLNFWTHSSTNQPLNFYIGYLEEMFFGPLNMLLNGLALSLLGWRYLRDVNGKVFAFAIFCFLIVTKFEILLFPPYGDALGGPLAEAMWLYQNDFNYKLLAEQGTYLEGGPKVYFFTIYPGFIALLLKLIPNTKIFLIINHLIVFIFGAVSVSCLRSVLLKIYSKGEALLVSFLFLAMPLFQAQVEQINMEMMLVFFSMLAMFFMVQKKFMVAALMAAGAALTKGTGILVSGAVCSVCLFLFFWGKEERFQWRLLVSAALALVVVVAKYYCTFFILHDGPQGYLVGFFQGWKENKRLPVLYLCLASFLTFCGVFIFQIVNKRTKTFAEYLRQNYVLFVGMVFMAAWWGLFIHSYAALYRYRLLLVPLNIFCTYYLFHLLIRKNNIRIMSLVVVIAFSFWGSYGLLYKKDNVILQYVSERSLEYRIDLKLQMDLAKNIERHFSKYTIGAPFIMAQALASPEYGYVSKPLDVLMYGFPAGYGGIRNYRLPFSPDEKIIWTGFKTHIPYEEKKIIGNYPLGPEDKIVEEMYYGAKKATIFVGGSYIQKKYLFKQIKIREYLKRNGHKILRNH